MEWVRWSRLDAKIKKNKKKQFLLTDVSDAQLSLDPVTEAQDIAV